MPVRIKALTDEAKLMLAMVRQSLSPEQLDPAVARAAAKIIAILIIATPKQSGQTAGGWVVLKPSEARRELYNRVEVSTSTRGRVPLLELLATGTGRYGPARQDVVSPNGRRMYVPISRRAALGWRPGLVYGRDYVLAYRVRGIRPLKRRRVIEQVTPRAEKILEDEVLRHLVRFVRL